jgi:CheY-like chemotaxis protein
MPGRDVASALDASAAMRHRPRDRGTVVAGERRLRRPPRWPMSGGPGDGRRGEEGRVSQVARQRHVLVVNDTVEILDLFRELLEEEGYRVSLYSFAFRDLAEIKADRPDLIILDFIIGGEDHGWQLLQKLKMDRETATIPVIVCTAAVRLVRDLEGHLKEKGVSVVLKPFDIDDLLREVTNCWQQREEDAGRPETVTGPG